MRNLLCILLVVFTKFTLLGGSSYAINGSVNSCELSIKSSSSIGKKNALYAEKNSDRSPYAKRKKRIKGITYEFLPSFSENVIKIVLADKNFVFPDEITIASYHLFCNGKRGPPAALNSI